MTAQKVNTSQPSIIHHQAQHAAELILRSIIQQPSTICLTHTKQLSNSTVQAVTNQNYTDHVQFMTKILKKIKGSTSKILIMKDESLKTE